MNVVKATDCGGFTCPSHQSTQCLPIYPREAGHPHQPASSTERRDGGRKGQEHQNHIEQFNDRPPAVPSVRHVKGCSCLTRPRRSTVLVDEKEWEWPAANSFFLFFKLFPPLFPSLLFFLISSSHLSHEGEISNSLFPSSIIAASSASTQSHVPNRRDKIPSQNFTPSSFHRYLLTRAYQDDASHLGTHISLTTTSSRSHHHELSRRSATPASGSAATLYTSHEW